MDSKDPLLGAAPSLIRTIQTWGETDRRVYDCCDPFFIFVARWPLQRTTGLTF
jgi:hypothetical protein